MPDERNTTAATSPRFAAFVHDVGALLDETVDEAAIIARGGELLRGLIADDDWLPDVYAQPDPQRYRQYRLHVDAAARFSVVSFVWGPGQRTPIHDHTVWGLIGVLRGAERSQRFVFDAQGRPQPRDAAEWLHAGEVEAVSPSIGDVHQVANAYDDRVSISIHVYGADIGAVRRSVYAPDGERKLFVSGYSNDAPPSSSPVTGSSA
jgi:predicted metal-dependent enzyme (double-stranded beta helix superfamily)